MLEGRKRGMGKALPKVEVKLAWDGAGIEVVLLWRRGLGRLKDAEGREDGGVIATLSSTGMGWECLFLFTSMDSRRSWKQLI